MNFASALFALKRGRKIKRHHWTGYWCLGSKDSRNLMSRCTATMARL